MLARSTAATPWGIEARPVHVEVHVRHGLPQIHIVGLPDTAVRESRQRVRSAIANCGFKLPPKVVVINLAPADLPKAGNHLDLGIAGALLSAYGHLPAESLDGRLLVGELGLDGGIRPIRGGLAIAALGKRRGMRELLVPFDNAGEAAAIGALPVIPLTHLSQAIEHLTGVVPIQPFEGSCWAPLTSVGPPDLAEVRGQAGARRALEIAAAGGHNLLLIGPPGSGKTMLVRRLPGILPRLNHGESVAVTQIHSSAGAEPPRGLLRQRPLRSPHSTVSGAGLLGGGSIPRPGEVTLAHCGVLFLDELPEFRRDSLDALRQPLEDGTITVVRARGRITFPARFSLVAAMNPCRCGHLGDPRHECCCTPSEVERYRSRVSGPLLDRIDLHVEVPAVTLGEIRKSSGESTAVVAERVHRARKLQVERLRFEADNPTNAALSNSLLRRHCRLEIPARKLVDNAFERLGLSARGLNRVLKVSRTIADLAGHQRITAADIAEAVQYRALDHRHRQ